MNRVHTTVFSVIKNGITNGYPFVESYGSWLSVADRIFILDGYSTDGTDVVLSHLAALSPKFVIQKAPWPKASEAGTSIAQFTNQCLEMVRPYSERLIYIQADEVLTPETRTFLAEPRAEAIELSRYVLFWNSFYKVIRFETDLRRERSTDWHAIKSFPSQATIRSVGDGLSFELAPSTPKRIEPQEVLHYGWNFPVNILQKHVSHANLYSENLRYRRRAIVARAMLDDGNYSLESLDAMDPEYVDRVRPFVGSHPACMQHVLSQKHYDPYVGLSILQQGAKW